MTMKKYIEPNIEMLLLTSQVAIQAASQVTVKTEETVDAQNIESRRNYNVWDDDEEEEEEDF